MIRKGYQTSTVFQLYLQQHSCRIDIEQSKMTPCQGLVVRVDPQAQLLLNLLVGDLHGLCLKSWTKEL
jgi:hypothetical protein